MSSNDDAFTLDKIKDNYAFISSLDPYYIYKELGQSCEKNNNSDACYPESNVEGEQNPETKKFLKDYYSSLYKITSAARSHTNDYYDQDKHNKIKKMGVIYLKYWLYDEMLKKNFYDSQIGMFFQGLKTYIEPKIEVKYPEYSKINELTFSEIKSIKKLYALYTIFYGNTNNSSSCIGEQCKYIDYFGEGLDEFINSINRCSSDLSTGNYCKEFKEFIDICKDKDLNAGISIYDEQTQSTADTKEKYLLSVEKYQNKPLYIYLKDEKLINFVKTSHFIRTKNSATIAATSVVGSAIGLSSIFYYLYKFTPFGNTLRKVKGKNIVNMDEEQNDLLYTSHTEQIPFKNRKYNVAYQNFSDT